MPDTLTGGCHCGQIRYTLASPPMFQFTCHCDGCRTLNGGMRLTGVSGKLDDLTVEGTTSTYTYAGGKADIELHFCGHCSTQVMALPKAYPGMAVLRANTLADHGHFAPSKSLYTEQACTWDTFVD